MTKTPRPKNLITKSPHSRSSRRATSPALEGNLDKSLRNLPRPSSPSTSKPNRMLAPRSGTGITKKKNGKVLKRKQRVRVEQGREKAEVRRGKLEAKVERSERRGVGRRGRKTDWDELNDKIAGKKRQKKGKGLNEGVEEDGWMDEDMEDVDADTEANGKTVSLGGGDMAFGSTTNNKVDVAEDEIT